MIIKSIQEPVRNNQTALADMLLAKKRFNDPLFESIAYRITVALDEPLQAFCRLFWESSCIKTNFKNYVLHADNTIMLNCTLSECIKFVRDVTPPRFMKQVDDEMSVENIRDFLNLYLINSDADTSNYNTQVFQQDMGLNYIDSGYQPDFGKLEFLMSKNVGTIITLVDACTVPFGDLFNKDPSEIDGAIQLTVQAISTKDCIDAYDFINNARLIVDRVYWDPKHGICTSCYTTNITPEIVNKIKECYKSIV